MSRHSFLYWLYRYVIESAHENQGAQGVLDVVTADRSLAQMDDLQASKLAKRVERL